MLIEVVATIAITLLLINFAFPIVASGTTPARLLALVSSAASVLREARTAAIVGGRPVAAHFDAGRRRLQAGRNALTIPADVDFSLVAGGNCPADPGSVDILFRADGTNCGGLLRFRKDRRVLRARVNWADGHIDVAEGG